MIHRNQSMIATSAVVREAIRMLEEHHAHRQAELERARGLIKQGAKQLDRGQTIDGDSFFAEWDRELEAANRTKL